MERLIVWGGIGVLCVIIVFEAGAKFSYSSAMREIRDVEQRSPGEPMKIDEITPLIKRKPVITDDKLGVLDVKVYTWTWRGIFKTYTIRFVVDSDHEITGTPD